MKKLAVVTKNETKDILKGYIDSPFDSYYLTGSTDKKILKKDITLDLSLLDEYEFVILIGADCAKHIGGIGSVVKHQGYLVDDKWLALANPRMLKFNPAGANAFENALGSIKQYISGTKAESKAKKILVQDEDEITHILQKLISEDPDVVALDTETTGLYPRDGYVLGISITWVDDIGYYIDADYINDLHVKLLQQIISTTNHSVLHNAKFDIHMLKYHFGLVFNKFDDTMLLHYALNEQTGTHGLKDLCIKYTDLGDYDKELDTFKREYCRKNRIKLGDFTYDLIPFEILGEYAALDTVGTYKLFNLFYTKVRNSVNLWRVYSQLLIPGTAALLVIEDNGVPMSEEQLILEKEQLDIEITELEQQIYEFEVIHEFELNTGKVFNSNSVNHKREIFFDMLHLRGSGKKTETGKLSVDAEVMGELAEQHDLPKLIAKIAKAKKIKSTYIDKIIVSLDSDSRLRTGFNLQTTTSGRLSSSGKLNMQQLPRDRKAPKRCIKARDGYKIVSGD